MLNVLMLIAGLILAFWFIGNAMGFLLMLLVAALVGFAADSLVPGRQIEHGWLGAMGAGLVGSWLGTLMLGRIGPVLMGVPLLPALVGALVLVLVVSVVRKRPA
ncbi:GlsB/YeaQ/YmgE family stress response membrane protein [bacterium]|nr:GlsB/YeaQ/YmgE family stress response membrane protein [bacterium]